MVLSREKRLNAGKARQRLDNATVNLTSLNARLTVHFDT
jgi:hypothetical protein